MASTSTLKKRNLSNKQDHGNGHTNGGDKIEHSHHHHGHEEHDHGADSILKALKGGGTFHLLVVIAFGLRWRSR
jgi:hypothetical protein